MHRQYSRKHSKIKQTHTNTAPVFMSERKHEQRKTKPAMRYQKKKLKLLLKSFYSPFFKTKIEKKRARV